MAVHVHGVGGGNGDVVEQAEAVGAVGVVGAGHHAHGSRMVPRRPDHAEGVVGLFQRR